MDKPGLLKDDSNMTTESSGQTPLCVIAKSGFLHFRKLDSGEKVGQSEYVTNPARRCADSILIYSIQAYHGRNI